MPDIRPDGDLHSTLCVRCVFYYGDKHATAWLVTVQGAVGAALDVEYVSFATSPTCAVRCALACVPYESVVLVGEKSFEFRRSAAVLQLLVYAM